MPEKTEKKPSKEDLLLERLDRMEGQLQTLVQAQQSLAELKADVTPLLNSAVRLLIDELGMVEGFTWHAIELRFLINLPSGCPNRKPLRS